MAETVGKDFSLLIELGPNLDTDQARQAALDERLPQEGMGLVRAQDGLPEELLLITDDNEAHAMAAAGNKAKVDGISPADWSVEAVKRSGTETEFLVARGIHWAATSYNRVGRSTDSSTAPTDLNRE